MADRDYDNRRRGYDQDWRERERWRSGEAGVDRGYGRGMDEDTYRRRDEERFGRSPSQDYGRMGRDMGRDYDRGEGRYRQMMDTGPSQWQRDMGGGLSMDPDEYYARYDQRFGDEGRFYRRDDERMVGREMDEGRFYGRGVDENRGYMPSPMRGRGMDEGRYYGRGMPEASYGRGDPDMRMRFDPVRGYGRMQQHRFGAGGPGMLGLEGGFGGEDMRDEMMQRSQGRGPKGYRRSDERIREDINDRLMQHHWADSTEVDVQVKDGEVTLMGTVADRRTKREIEDVAEAVLGVHEVQNLLRIRREEPMLGRGREEDGSMRQQGQQAQGTGSFQQQQPSMKASTTGHEKNRV